MNTKGLKKAIKIAGGQTALAKAINRCSRRSSPVKQTHVWNWLHRNKCVPAKRVLSVEKATGGEVTRRELRPDLYPRE